MSDQEPVSNNKILQGITVVDFTSYVTGGFATLMLANLGAEVIKIERPDVGENNRHSGPPFMDTDTYEGRGRIVNERGISPYFLTTNYGKKSVGLDLKSEDGLEIMYDLVTEADIFIENFRPGVAERLGVGYEDISARNEDIIYCSMSAFGDSGPWSDQPGMDLLIQGMSGVMSVTGTEDGQPVKVGIAITDLITGMWGAFGIVSALYRRSITGKGDYIEFGMLDAAISWLTKQAGKTFVGQRPEPMGTKDPYFAPYQTYKTADSKLNIACSNQRLWEDLCEAIERQDLKEDSRFKTPSDRVDNMEALEAELNQVFQTKPTEKWIDILTVQYDVPAGPLLEIDEALNHEQVQARDIIGSVDHPALGEIPEIDHPLNFMDGDTGFDGHPPLLGQHTGEILKRLGYSDSDIESLLADEVVTE